MKLVRKVLSVAALGALITLVLVGVVALVTIVVRNPLRSATVGAIVLVVAFVVSAVVNQLVPRVKRGTILELDLPTAPVEAGGQNKLAALSPNKPLSLGDVVDTLNRASRDKRVAGLIVRPRFGLAPRAAIDELRQAIVDFGASGKFTLAITDSFGEGEPANGSYLLATACQEITVQESGYVGLTPLSVESNFYPDVLARLGIEVQVFGRGKYKSAPNQATERGFTAADREQTKRLLDSFWDHGAEQIAQARSMTTPEIGAYADRGPLLAHEAFEAGLIDRVAYPDEAIADAKARVGSKAKLLYLNAYKKRAGKGRRSGKTVTVAVIRAVGEIHRSAGNMPVGLTGGSILAPDALVPLIRAAAKDKDVKAVVLRIDSPGGSALASDTMWHELVRLREAGKPLVASMASVAASGGYYIAAPADRIVAQPTTVTGSIGVFGVQPVLTEAKAKLKVHTDEIHTGKEPSSFSVNRKVSRTRKKRLDLELDEIYGLFTQRVAEGRKRGIDEVLEVAQGRVWTGADAVGAGLVDELGGLDRALEVAVELTGAKAGTRAKVKMFPKKANALASLRRPKSESSDDPIAASVGIRSWSLEGLTGVVAHIGFDPRRYWLR